MYVNVSYIKRINNTVSLCTHKSPCSLSARFHQEIDPRHGCKAETDVWFITVNAQSPVTSDHTMKEWW